MKVIVVGGGIAGLTAALCLLRKKIDVVVIEQAERFREIGAGIQIGANGTIVMSWFALPSRAACPEASTSNGGAMRRRNGVGSLRRLG